MTVAAKRIQVSVDDATYYTLPGNTGSISYDGSALDDTIFGQPFKSQQPSLINTKITSQAFYKGFAGYTAVIQTSGTSTAFTNEAATNTSGHKWQISDVTKRVWDPAITVHIKDGATNIDAQIKAIDYLSGVVTLSASYTVVGAITLSGNYLPMSTVAKSNGFTLNMTADATDITAYTDAQSNAGHNVFQPGLITISSEFKGFYDVTKGFRAALEARQLFVISINPDGNWPTSGEVFKGFFKPMTYGHSGNVGAVEEDTVHFDLFVVDSSVAPYMIVPFERLNKNSTLAFGVGVIIASFLSQTMVYVKYLPDGTNGVKGQGVITNCTLSGGVNAMNSFAADFQMSGSISTTTFTPGGIDPGGAEGPGP